jgi:hypothetical protein
MTAWQGRSGQSYAFWIYALDERLPATPGVYAYAKPAIGVNAWTVVYLGQTDCFADEIVDDGRRKAEAMGATHVLLHCRGGGANQRVRVERDLVAELDPPLNRETADETEPPVTAAVGAGD